MKITVILGLLLSIIFISGCVFDSDNEITEQEIEDLDYLESIKEEARDEGYKEGYDTGYEEGQQTGYDDGYSDGESDCYCY